jgi:uncharacterized repeat protein (TIGR01451 family)
MALKGRRLFLLLLLAVGVCPLGGCFGLTQNPNYFPWLLPDEDIIRTHAKPPGAAYYANFDPHAVRLEVRPIQQTNPTRTQLVLIATVYDGDGPDAKPRRDRRVEWIVEGVGHIVEVDESGCFPGRGHKIDSKYAVSYTNYHEHRISRGTQDPSDDFVVRPGQTWCVITSAVEGDTYVTAYAPGVYNWQRSRVFTTYHWVDAAWTFPPPAQARAGSEHVFTTQIFRPSDHQPLANYRVRYKILDGPPAVLISPRGREQETVVVSGLSGNANVSIAELTPQLGKNRVSVEVIRPPDPTATSGVGITLAQGETSVEWLAPAVALAHEGPPTVSPGQEFAFTTRVKNTGRIESQAMTVREGIPPGVRYLRSEPPAIVEREQLIWTLGVLPPGQEHRVQAFFNAPAPGTITSVASVETVEGLRDQQSATVQVTQPQLRVMLNGPQTGVVGAPVTYQITVSNPGTGAANNVRLSAAFEEGLKHETAANPVTMALGTFGPGESRIISPPLVLTPQKAGQFKTTVTVTAEGGVLDRAEHLLTVQTARLGVNINGPSRKYSDRSVEWNITVKNEGDAPLDNVVLRDRLPPELTYEGSVPVGTATSGEVSWSLGSLAPGAARIIQVTTRTAKTPGKALHVVSATADPNQKAEAQRQLDILGIAALRLEAVDIGDPAEVGKQVTYQIEVTNTGNLPANQVEITAFVPPELQPVTAEGPTGIKGKINRQIVAFDKLPALQPNQTVRYNIEARAVKAGDVRFRVRLNSLALQSPVEEEESTTIVDPSAPAVPARPAADRGPLPPPAGPQLPAVGVPGVPPP